jgi:hypothetical protein
LRFLRHTQRQSPSGYQTTEFGYQNGRPIGGQTLLSEDTLRGINACRPGPCRPAPHTLLPLRSHNSLLYNLPSATPPRLPN